MIKVVSRHQTTQKYGMILPIELTNDDIKNSKAYKEYYACATERTEAEQLKIVLKRSRQETHISQQHGSDTDEGTGSRPGVPDVPSDDSEEELSWNSSDDEDVDEQTKGREESEGDKTDESDDDDDKEETTKIGAKEVAESDEGDDEATESDKEREDEETREQEEESFDLIPRNPEDDEDDDNNKEDQGLRIGEEERMQEEEEAEELYRDFDAQQESSLTSSFMTNLLNPITDPGLESLFTTGSTTGTPIPSPQSTMTPSIISTFTSASQLPTHPTQFPSLDLQSLPTFALVFHFEDRVKSLEDNFSNIPGIVKTQVKAQVTRILPRIEEAVNAQLEAEALVEAYDADKTILDTYGESTILKRRREDDDQEGPSAGSDRGSKRRREGGDHASASTPSEQATGSVGRSTTGSQSRQLSASESAFTEEPMQPTCQMKEPSHPVFKTSAEDQPIIQTSQHPEWRIIAVTELKIMEWHNYKHFDWISVRRDDDKIYKFKECDLKRLRIQDIEDMLLLLVQGKLSNLTVEERFAFNVSLRMFTRRIVIQRRVEDLQLGVKSYQKRLNLIRPDTYRSDLKRREAYTA
nr:hypothetical protein [Tanacetum cinerariifolium]